MRMATYSAAAAWVFAGSTAFAQDAVTAPTDQQAARVQQPAPAVSADLGTTTILGQETSGDDLVGPYAQPAWTARSQRWATTRAYVLPEGHYELEFFYVGSFDGDEEEHEFLEEIKIGLPHRFQLDLYATQKKERPDQDHFHGDEFKIELRHALANWGEIFLNPTLYLEWETAQDGSSEAMEYKLLLAENLAPGWAWGLNLIYEDHFNSNEIEYGFSTGVNYEVNNHFGVGAELEVIWEREHGHTEESVLLGPSFEYRPTDRTSLRLVPLFGLTSDSPDVEVFAVFAIGFGGPEDEGGFGPGVSERR